MAAPTLYIFAGLPASGKTTLAQLLAVELKAVHLRIDTIEQALRKRQAKLVAMRKTLAKATPEVKDDFRS